ncbi:hypothetical protein MRX96_011900 [Rhipicephalus microplus]
MRVSTKPPDTRNNQPPMPGHFVLVSFPTSPGRTQGDMCVVQPLPSWDPSEPGDTRKSSTGAYKVFLGYEEVASGQKSEPWTLTISGDVVEKARAPLVREEDP